MAIKIEDTILKASKRDIENGFKSQNVFKYNLGGRLGDSLDKTEKLINNLVGKANSLRGASKANISLDKIVVETAEDVLGNKIENLGTNRRVASFFKEFVSELESIAPDGKINTVDAQKIKVALGKLGSWVNGQRDLDAKAQEKVANAFYSKFKTAIENAVDDPKELQDLNKQLSELIPIQNVLLKRIPIANRNQALSLSDILTASAGFVDPKGWGLFVINQLSKSGRFASLLYKGSTKLKSGAEKLLPLETGIKNFIKSPKLLPKGKGGIPKTTLSKFERAKNLTPEDRNIETKAFKRIAKQENEILRSYKKNNGKVINTDNFRPFFSKDGYKGYNSTSVQEPSSYLSKKAFTNELKNPEEFATFFAGGSGTGKTSAINNIDKLKPILNDSAVVLDSNLSSLSSARAKINEAINAGKSPAFIYTYREPMDSFVNGVIARMKNNVSEGGRIVPSKIVAGNHIDSWDVIKTLQNEGYAINFIDNSLGRGKQKLLTFKEISDKIKYPSKEELIKQFNNKAKELYAKGTISKEQYQAYIK
jgi:hypothetical protein